MRIAVKIEERCHSRIGNQDNIPTVTTIPSVWPAQRLKLLAPDRDATIATVTSLHMHDDTVDKRRHLAQSPWFVPNKNMGGEPKLAPHSVCLVILVGDYRQNVDDFATRLGAKLNRARFESEQCVVATAPDVSTRMKVRSTLANNNLTSVDNLAAKTLNAETLSI